MLEEATKPLAYEMTMAPAAPMTMMGAGQLK
jgi:hypothetical protein